MTFETVKDGDWYGTGGGYIWQVIGDEHFYPKSGDSVIVHGYWDSVYLTANAACSHFHRHPGGGRDHGGELDFRGYTLAIEGMSLWDGGMIAGMDVGSTLRNTGTLTLAGADSGPAVPRIGQRYDNQGTTIQSSGRFGICAGTRVENHGLYDMQCDGNISWDWGGGGWPRFYNHAGATLRKSSGTGTGHIRNVEFYNLGGTIDVQSGTLAISAGGTNTGGTFNVAPGALLDLSVAPGRQPHHVTGTYTGSGGGEVRLGIDDPARELLVVDPGGATLDFPDDMLHWTAGVILANDGTLTNGGTLNISGSGHKRLIGTLNNNGTINHTGGGLEIFRNSVVNNASDALYELHDSGANVGGLGNFNNAGTLRKTGGGISTFAATLKNSPGGVVDVQSGTLAILEGSMNTGGTFNVAPGALLDLSVAPGRGPHHFTGTYTGSGGGEVRLGTDDAGREVLVVDPGGATLDFPDDMLHWTAGVILANDGTLTNVGTLNISGGDYKRLCGTLNNDGIVTHSGGNFDIFWGNGVVNNASDALYDLQGDANIVGHGTLSAFNNAGTLRKSGGGTSTFQPILNNTGTVEVLSGTLTATGNVPQLSGTTLTGGTWRVGPGAALNLTKGSNIATNQGTVELTGPGAAFPRINTIADNQGYFGISGGCDFDTVGGLGNSGTLSIGTGSTMTVNGDYQAPPGSLTIVLGILNVAGTAQIGGTLGGDGTIVGDVELPPGTVLTPGASPGTLLVDGDLTCGDGFTYDWEVGLGESDLVSVTGSLSFGDTAVLNVIHYGGSLPQPGDYMLFSAEGGISTVGPPPAWTIILPDGWSCAGIHTESHAVYLADLQPGGGPPPVIPEPVTLSLLGLGLAAMGWSRRRKRT